MRILIQRVSSASVTVEGEIIGKVGQGMLILLGIETEDNDDDIDYLVRKIIALRIFEDEQGVMNNPIKEISGEILIVSQFTLHASTKKGNRPSYIRAARPEIAIPLYEKFVEALRSENIKIETGRFGAMMQVTLINDGPVTIWMDSKNKE